MIYRPGNTGVSVSSLSALAGRRAKLQQRQCCDCDAWLITHVGKRCKPCSADATDRWASNARARKAAAARPPA